jgi:hypothetical protein
MPGATPDVVKSELERSRAGTEKVGETAMGLAKGPVDPWMYLATDKQKFMEMLNADPINTLAMMLPGLEGARRGIALPKEGGTIPPTSSIRAEEAPGPTTAGAPKTTEPVPAPPVERRAQPSPEPRQDLEALVAKAEQPGTPEAQQAAYREAHKAVYDTVAEKMKARGTEDPTGVFLESSHLTNLNDRLSKIQESLTAAAAQEPAPEVLHGVSKPDGSPVVVRDLTDEQLAAATKHTEDMIARRKADQASGGFVLGGDFPEANLEKLKREAARRQGPTPGEQPGELGQKAPGAGAEQAPGDRTTAPVPSAEPVQFTYAGKMDTKNGPIHYWKPDRLMPVTGEIGRQTAESIRKNGLEPPTPPGRTVFQGRGAPPEKIYGPERVAAGNAGPIFGPADYYAHTRKEAAFYGDVTEHPEPQLKKPLVLDSDAKWFQLLRDAETPHLNSVGMEQYKNPSGVIPDTLKLQAYVKAQGYDGVVVKLDPYSDNTRRMYETFAHDQTIAFRPDGSAPARDSSTESPAGEPTPSAGAEPHAIGESLRYGKQRVVVREVLRDGEGNLQGYRVKAKGDKPFVIKPEDAVAWENQPTQTELPRPPAEEVPVNQPTEAPPAPELPPPVPIDREALKARVDDLKELEQVVPQGPVKDAAGRMGKGQVAKHMREERAAIEEAVQGVERSQGKPAADALRQEIGWNPVERAETPSGKKGGSYEQAYPNPTPGVERAADRPVPLEKNLKPKRPEAVIRAQDIKRRLEQAVLAPIRYGIGMKKARGFFRLAERIIRTKKYLDLPVDFHEAGHALQEILFPEIDMLKGKKGFNIKGPNSKAMRQELTALGKALYGDRKPAYGYKSEGLAEFTRLYIEDRDKAKTEAPKFFEEFQRRLLQDADTIDIGRVLDESKHAYDLYRSQPSVARALAMQSIGESKPRRWSLDRVSSALFDSQKFIESMVKALNGGLRPDFDLGNPITHAHLLRGWTGLAENALREGGGVANFKESGTFEKIGPSVSDIISKPGVADQPLPFVNEAVRAYEKMSPTERLLRGMTNKFEDAKNMRGLDSLRAYWYARRTISIAEGDLARSYARKANVSDVVALKYVKDNLLADRKGATFRDTGLSMVDARQVVKDLETPALKQAVEDLTTYSNNVLRWFVHEGMWTADQYRRVVDHPANQVYMPMDRWFSEYGDRGRGLQGRSISGARPDVGRLKGSDVPIIDPFETLVANTFMAAQSVQRNRAMRSLVEFAADRPGSGWASELVGKPMTMTKFRMAELKPQIDNLIERAGGDPTTLAPEDYETWGRIFRPAMEPRGGRNIATYFDRGKEKWAEMDPEVYRAVSGMDQESMPKFIHIFGAPARWLRAGATITPDFIFRNFFRDPITSSVLSETGTVNPFSGSVPFVTTIKGMREILRNGDASFRYRASGATHAAMVSLDRDYLRGQARSLLSDGSKLGKISGVVLHPWQTLQALGELVESGTRIGTQMAELAHTAMSHDDILRGAIKSREGTTDFNRYGTALEPVARLVPFFNPGLQSVRRFNVVTGRAIADVVNSVRAAAGGDFRSPDYAARYASRVLTYVVAPSVLLHFLRKDMGRQDEYLELPAWRRHLFLNVPLPEGAAKRWGVRWVSLPKAFEVGVLYGTGSEVMLEQMEKTDPKAVDEYQSSLVGAFMPNTIPAFLAGAVENAANRKIAFDRLIMPESQKGLKAREQYGLYTSDTAKVLAEGARHVPDLVGKPIAFVIKLGGEQKDINAYDVDNVIQDLTAGLGRNYVTPALDFVIRRVLGGTKEAERLGIGKADVTKTRPTDVPMVRAFFPRPSETGSGLLERTYQDINEADKAWNTYLQLDGWRKDEFLQDPENRRLIVAHSKLEDVRLTLSTINKLTLKARKEGDDEMVDHLRSLAIDAAHNAPKEIQAALDDPTAMKAIAIDWELAKMRSEGHARHAEAATVLEDYVENKADDAKIRGYLEGMAPEDRRWATGYVQALRKAQKLNAEREAVKGASHREKLHLKEAGMLPAPPQ